ncbi:MAG: alpha-L-arabinofuranosidase C-terminal domain-containing protein [Paludibacteraceae bacterium]
MNRRALTATVILFFLMSVSAQPTFILDLAKKGVAISPTHYGIFFEDINHAGDGGLYAELIRNRSFEDAATPEYWTTFNQTNTAITISLENAGLLNTAQSKALKMNVVTSAGTSNRAGVYNTGYWGINVVDRRQYKLSFFAKCDANFKGELIASLESNSSVKYAEARISGITTEWQKFTCTLTANGNDPNARFAIASTTTGTIWLDMVSLFPPTYKNHENGLRPDLAQLLEDMKPKFMRFPGGCFVEGDVLANKFQWKKSVGKIEERPGHWNLWGYRTTDGMGYHEFLQLAEDIGAEPLYVVNVGLAHNDNQPAASLDGYIQDALDAIEYANGELTTPYGAMRAANGHPDPFNLKYVEVGNENYYGNSYGSRYTQFYNAIKTKYPSIQLIGNVAAWGTDNPVWDIPTPADMVDEHYYRDPQWFMNQYNKYDTYNRNGPKIYVGEYAVTSGCGKGNLIAAIGEAAYMTGMEKNSDIVVMNSYAPIFVNDNNRAWNPDMIVYNASSVYCTPSYYVQKMFANNIGTVNVQLKDSLNTKIEPVTGNIGLGTWATTAEYSQVNITDGSKIVFADNFSNNMNWTPTSGIWNVTGGVYAQTSTATDCRSVGPVISDSTYTYSLKAKKTGGNEGFLIIFGYKDKDNFYWWNIGGWGNTQHAIERCSGGAKSVVAKTAGSIVSDRIYDVRIEVSKTRVLCYLDNVLIHTLDLPVSKTLYTSATLDENSRDLYIKVINPASMEVNAPVKLIGINTGNFPLTGTATELTSSDKLNENSFTNPTNIVPVETGLSIASDTFNYTFKSNSITILKINTGLTNRIKQTESTNRKIKIYPNPASNNLNIKGINELSSVNIYNSKGQTILKKKIVCDSNLDIAFLNKGIYIIEIKNKKETFSEKFLKEIPR